MAQEEAPPEGPLANFSSSVLWCLFYSTGITVMLVIYGVLQERIMTLPYGAPGAEQLFSFSVFLVFCNRTAAVAFSASMAAVRGEPFRSQAPLWKCLIISLSNVFASTCQYESLKYISFALQMLGKSFKMMPVMAWGTYISGKHYGTRDWLVAVAVTLGVTEFIMTGPMASPVDSGNSIRGLLWLAAFLALDGLTSTMQEKLFREHHTSKYNQMLYVNLFSALISVITLTSSNTFGPALRFCGAHGWFVSDAAMLSASAVGGQFFIYSEVKEFGALVFAATMNVRQVVSISVSYITYGHRITMSQVTGLILVFAALFYKSYMGFVEHTTTISGEKQCLLSKEPDVETPNSRRAIDLRLAELQKD